MGSLLRDKHEHRNCSFGSSVFAAQWCEKLPKFYYYYHCILGSTMPNLLEASRLQFFPRLKSRGSNSIFFLRIRTFAGRILVELQSNAGDLLGRIYYYEELLHFDCEATANYRQNLHLKSRKQHGN